MKELTFGLLALAAGFFIQGVTPSTALASPAGKAAASVSHDGSGLTLVRSGRHHGMGRHHFGHHRQFRHHRSWGPRIHFRGGYGGGCYWLKERAMDSGSRYWWRRYNACRQGW